MPGPVLEGPTSQGQREGLPLSQPCLLGIKPEQRLCVPLEEPATQYQALQSTPHCASVLLLLGAISDPGLALHLAYLPEPSSVSSKHSKPTVLYLRDCSLASFPWAPSPG